MVSFHIYFAMLVYIIKKDQIFPSKILFSRWPTFGTSDVLALPISILHILVYAIKQKKMDATVHVSLNGLHTKICFLRGKVQIVWLD